MPTHREMAALAASLKTKIQQNKLRLRRAGLSSDLPAEMLQALELLESTFDNEGLEDIPTTATSDDCPNSTLEGPSTYNLPASFLHRLEGKLESTLESTLQPWLTNLDGSTAQFSDFLSSLQETVRATAQMEKDYAERLTQIEQKRIQLAEQMAKSQALEWRLARQRKNLAQSFRAQRAEMHLEFAKARAELDQRLADAMDEEWVRVDEESNQLRNELRTANQHIEQLQDQLKQARESEAQKHGKDDLWQGKLAELERQLSETQEQLFRSANQLSDYDSRLSSQDAELSRKEAELKQKEAALGQKVAELNNKEALLGQHAEQLSELQKQLTELRSQLSQVQQQLTEKQQQLVEQGSQLEEARTQCKSLQSSLDARSEIEAPKDQVDVSEWESKWEQAQAEMIDLREQNSELATRIAQLTADSLSSRNGSGTANPELLSWEERKRLMLQQLEQGVDIDDDSYSNASEKERLDMQQLIATTQKEIDRRDREIEELREIVQLQSEARQGMAIGAAGVAQLLDNNDLINQEREKLKEMQQEWEAKLRQAEIDLSMERAKLARERSEMELELAQLKRAAAQEHNVGISPGDKKERRWKNFLGIKEESKE